MSNTSKCAMCRLDVDDVVVVVGLSLCQKCVSALDNRIAQLIADADRSGSKTVFASGFKVDEIAQRFFCSP